MLATKITLSDTRYKRQSPYYYAFDYPYHKKMTTGDPPNIHIAGVLMKFKTKHARDEWVAAHEYNHNNPQACREVVATKKLPMGWTVTNAEEWEPEEDISDFPDGWNDPPDPTDTEYLDKLKKLPSPHEMKIWDKSWSQPPPSRIWRAKMK